MSEVELSIKKTFIFGKRASGIEGMPEEVGEEEKLIKLELLRFDTCAGC